MFTEVSVIMFTSVLLTVVLTRESRSRRRRILSKSQRRNLVGNEEIHLLLLINVNPFKMSVLSFESGRP